MRRSIGRDKTNVEKFNSLWRRREENVWWCKEIKVEDARKVKRDVIGLVIER